jgi:hypothetical protein
LGVLATVHFRVFVITLSKEPSPCMVVVKSFRRSADKNGKQAAVRTHPIGRATSTVALCNGSAACIALGPYRHYVGHVSASLRTKLGMRYEGGGLEIAAKILKQSR